MRGTLFGVLTVLARTTFCWRQCAVEVKAWFYAHEHNLICLFHNRCILLADLLHTATAVDRSFQVKEQMPPSTLTFPIKLTLQTAGESKPCQNDDIGVNPVENQIGMHYFQAWQTGPSWPIRLKRERIMPRRWLEPRLAHLGLLITCTVMVKHKSDHSFSDCLRTIPVCNSQRQQREVEHG